MITNYNLFLLNEGITMSNEDVVEILKSLETEDNRNSELINRLVNKEEKNGKTVLMTIVQSNNMDLVDYILKFNIDINKTLQSGENVLFFCKNLKMFKKFYDLGADPLSKNIHIDQNVLLYLASKKIFNVELYQSLINDGVSIDSNKNGVGVISSCMSNQKIVELLIKNNVNLNDKNNQINCFYSLFYDMRYFKNRNVGVIKMFILLFNNGMKIIDVQDFSNNVVELRRYPEYNPDKILSFIEKLKNYLNGDVILEIYKKYSREFYDKEDNIKFAKELLNITESELLYNYLKKYFNNFYNEFKDFIDEHPYMDDVGKYNL